MDAWAREHGVRSQLVRPGRQLKNAHIEGFNERLREECLNQDAFVSIDDVCKRVEAWRINDNAIWAHGVLEQPAPDQFRQLHQPAIGQATNLQLVHSTG
jgi:putative transposase